jgi:hypothetical protein
MFWDGIPMQWSVIARVDGKAYSLMGVEDPSPDTTAATVNIAEYSATHTTFTLSAGNIDFVLDFFSPVAPADYVRQSLPFSYLTVSASPTDGNTHEVQVYSDIDDSWIARFGTAPVNFTYKSTVANNHLLTLTSHVSAPFTQGGEGIKNEMPAWGSAVYCTTQSGQSLEALVGEVYTVRNGFATNGTLIGHSDWVSGGVAGFSHGLGNISSTMNVTFAVGLWQQAAINYVNNSRTGYFMSSCADVNACCAHAMEDFEAAEAEGRALDAWVSQSTYAVAGANYSSLATLSLRQAFGAIELTIPVDSLNTSNVMAFLKEISSDGNVNTVDVIYPMSPVLYVMAPEYLRFLLEPIMQCMAAGYYDHPYAIHDIGPTYPDATCWTGQWPWPSGPEVMPVEESADLILVAATYQAATGDSAWANRYRSVFQGYADFLIQNGTSPSKQLSSDDGSGALPNQTSLAIKSAVAINAFGKMFNMNNYSEVGLEFARTIYEDGLGLASDRAHFTYIEGRDDTWHLEYNFYVDVLLNLSTFPSSAYALQTAYYPNIRGPYGVPLANSSPWSKTDWQIWTAATAMAPGVQNTTIRDMFINDVFNFMVGANNDLEIYYNDTVPFSDKYWTQTEASGTYYASEYNKNDPMFAGNAASGYMARPVVGGHFAILALEGPNQVTVGAGVDRGLPKKAKD